MIQRDVANIFHKDNEEEEMERGSWPDGLSFLIWYGNGILVASGTIPKPKDLTLASKGWITKTMII
jgi:hypothetical protein